MSMLARLRRLDPALLLACASFVAFGLWGAHVLPAGHEEISTLPRSAGGRLWKRDNWMIQSV